MIKSVLYVIAIAVTAVLWRAFDDWRDGADSRREYRERKARARKL